MQFYSSAEQLRFSELNSVESTDPTEFVEDYFHFQIYWK